MQDLKTDVLVVGGGTGGTAAAIQAARRGAKTILVSEFPWLGGMLTAAGVSAPDGNELASFQTGIWGAFLRELQQRQPEGLDHAWVSFFTYEPQVGAAIFADWVKQLPNLQWLHGTPLEAEKQGDRITHVRFADYRIEAQVVLDATELGDLLPLAAVPHRWGWEWQSQWQEPSAPIAPNTLTETYPVQAPTWVVVLQSGKTDPIPHSGGEAIAAPPIDQPASFKNAWENYGAEAFLNYGRLPGNRFMINWPQQGNDYGYRLDRLIQSPAARLEFLQEARSHSQSFARFIQTQIGGCGLANVFPQSGLGGGAYALHPYYRESRRSIGQITLREQDILPQRGQVAVLPIDRAGQVTSIAVGNYANDHHYPGMTLPLQPKSIRWGGRWTGTPFTIPYGCLIPADIEGLLVCEKNISVSHIANGATRLQPLVLAIGQAAGMAAALCVEQNCLPQELAVRSLQNALLEDSIAPAAVVPLFNLSPAHPEWLYWQRYYLDHPDRYPADGNCPAPACLPAAISTFARPFSGSFQQQNLQDYRLITTPREQPLQIVTLDPAINQQLEQYATGQPLQGLGRLNRSGNWILVEQM